MKLYVFSNQVFVLESILVTASRKDGHKEKTKNMNKKILEKMDVKADERH